LSGAGAVYVFGSSDGGATWNQIQKLGAASPQLNELFGSSVSISGNIALVGARQSGPQNNGAVYVFVTSDGGSTWNQTQKLTAPDTAGFDSLGYSTSISGNVAFSGAIYKTVNGTSGAGAVYVFVTSDGGSTWSQTQKLTASEVVQNLYYGTSISISGNTAIIGCSSAAYILVGSNGGTTWNEVQSLNASDKGSDDNFGGSVSLSGNIALVSSKFRNSAGQTKSGAAYLYVSKDGGVTWPSFETQILNASVIAPNDEFGYAVSVSGSNVLIGAPDRDSSGLTDSGAAYLFKGPSPGPGPVVPPSGKPSNSTASDDTADNVDVSCGCS
jgi:hypothetical protein